MGCSNSRESSSQPLLVSPSVENVKHTTAAAVETFTNKKENNHHDPKTLGVSVYCLRNKFMRVVEEAGYNANSTIYEIEDLSKPTTTKASGGSCIIRNQGKDVTCPIDNQLGAAYVHCLHGEDYVGPANVMLSYTWGYKIGTIIDVLEDWCASKELNPKRTYMWICCLCVNQHRVVEEKKEKSGMSLAVDTDIFFKEFGDRVVQIGTILSLMEPWDDPTYLKRVWCIYEIYKASVTSNCNVEIVMPQKQKDLMVDAIVGGNDLNIDKLYDVTSNIDIRNANASVPDDKIRILQMIQSDIGYEKLNNTVYELLRQWVRDVIKQVVDRKSVDIKRFSRRNKSDYAGVLLSHAHLCSRVGLLFYRHGELDDAMIMNKKCLEIHLKLYGKHDIETAKAYNSIANIHKDKGDCANALIQYQKAIAIFEATLQPNDLSLATLYNNIGLVLGDMGRYDDALIYLGKQLKIHDTQLRSAHPDVASSYNSIGIMLFSKGDYNNALMYLQNALEIRETILKKTHPDVATTHNNIGVTLQAVGKYDDALRHQQKALIIRQAELKPTHPLIGASYNNIGQALESKGDYDDALTNYKKALQILQVELKPTHPNIAATCKNIENCTRLSKLVK